MNIGVGVVRAAVECSYSESIYDSEVPQRTTIPSILIVSVTTWLTSAGAYSLSRPYVGNFELETLQLLFLLESVVALGFASLRFRSSQFSCCINTQQELTEAFLNVLIGVSLGVLIALGGVCVYLLDRGCAVDSPAVKLLLLEDAKESEYGSRAICRALTANQNLITVTAYLPSSCCELLRGAEVSFKNTDISILEEVDEYSWSKGVVGKLTVYEAKINEIAGPFGFVVSIRNSAIAGLSDSCGESSGLIQALACGYTRGIEDSSIYEACKDTGLAHLIAVSGSHLVIVVGVFESILIHVGVRIHMRVAFSVGMTIMYLVFAGLPISGIRSGIMAIVASTSQLSDRRNSTLSSVAICVLLFVALDPKSCVSASLVLSAGSVLGIVLFSGLFVSWMECLGIKARFLTEPLSMTLASSLVTLPYSVSLFAQLPLVSLFANLVTTPLFPAMCVFSLLSSIFVVISEAAAFPFTFLATAVCQIFSELVYILASFPYAAVPATLGTPIAILISTLLVVGLLLCWPCPKSLAKVSNRTICLLAFATLSVLAGWTFSLYGREELIALDVGQGDAFLIRSQGRACLIDTGEDDGLLREALARNGVYDLDAVIITHGDNDHCGALSDLARVVNVDNVLLSEGVAECECQTCQDLLNTVDDLRGSPSLIYLKTGDVIDCGRFALTVLWPEMFESQGGNSDSLCLAGCYRSSETEVYGADSWSMLFAGDLESKQLTEIGKKYKLANIDILKVGHHGSRESLSREIAQSLRPRIALIGVGEGNRYGHPSAEVVSILKEIDSMILRTDLCGDVRLSFEGDCIEVETEHAVYV